MTTATVVRRVAPCPVPRGDAAAAVPEGDVPGGRRPRRATSPGGVMDVRVCVLGDSFTAGVGDPTGAGWGGPVATAARGAGWDLTASALGVRRDTSVDVARRWPTETEWRLEDGDRYGVVVAVGLNDVVLEDGRRRVARERSLATLAEVLDGAAARRWAALVVVPPPVSEAGESDRATELSAGMAVVCARRVVPFVDTTLADDAVWVDEVAAGDAHHPSTDHGRVPAVLDTWWGGLGGLACTGCCSP